MLARIAHSLIAVVFPRPIGWAMFAACITGWRAAWAEELYIA
jgi:hypothetical protein